MASTLTSPVSPVLAGLAPPPNKPLSFLLQLKAAKGNPFETLPLVIFEKPVHIQSSMWGRMVWVNDPDGIRRVLVENVANYPKNEMEVRILAAMFGEGLLTSDGEIWRTHRKIMAPSFDPRSIAAYSPAIFAVANEFVPHWESRAGTTVNIADEMQAITLQVVCKTLFSDDAEELAGLAGPALRSAQDQLSFGPFDVLPVIGPIRISSKKKVIRQIFSSMNTAIYRMIASRGKNLAVAPKDLLTRLISARDLENGLGMNPAEVRDQVVTIFMAGHETTAVALTWTWYVLSHYPEVEARLQAELDSVLGNRPPAAEDILNLHYTRAVLEEVMRLYPPAPALSVRTAKSDDEFCGLKVKAGSRVLISPWILHRHRTLWENPEQFNPDRFLAENSAARPRFAYLPFGAGPRVCIGAALAMTEATLILAALAQRFQPRLVPGQEVKLQTRVTLRPAGGIRMTLEPRRVQ